MVPLVRERRTAPALEILNSCLSRVLPKAVCQRSALCYAQKRIASCRHTERKFPNGLVVFNTTKAFSSELVLVARLG